MNTKPTQQFHLLLWQSVFQRLNIPFDDVQPLLRSSEQKLYPGKTAVVSAGQNWSKLYFVNYGILRMFYVDAQGRDFNKAFFAEHQCIWPVAPIDRNKSIKFNIATIEQTSLIELPFSLMKEFLQKQQKWEQFALPFAEGLVESKFRREHDLLMLSATERYQNFVQDNRSIIDRIPDYHLASILGITPVSLSRIKSAEKNAEH